IVRAKYPPTYADGGISIRAAATSTTVSIDPLESRMVADHTGLRFRKDRGKVADWCAHSTATLSPAGRTRNENPAEVIAGGSAGSCGRAVSSQNSTHGPLLSQA